MLPAGQPLLNPSSAEVEYCGCSAGLPTLINSGSSYLGKMRMSTSFGRSTRRLKKSESLLDSSSFQAARTLGNGWKYR